MFQIILEKFADWLLPVALGVCTWYGAHYTVFTPRVINADLPAMYQSYSDDMELPNAVGACVKTSIAKSVLEIGRLEAALYTASLRHLSQPFDVKLLEAERRLDEPCGISAAHQAALAKKKAELEEQRQRQALKQAKKLEKQKQRLAAEAEKQYQEQVKRQLDFFFDLLNGDQ